MSVGLLMGGDVQRRSVHSFSWGVLGFSPVAIHSSKTLGIPGGRSPSSFRRTVKNFCDRDGRAQAHRWLSGDAKEPEGWRSTAWTGGAVDLAGTLGVGARDQRAEQVAGSTSFFVSVPRCDAWPRRPCHGNAVPKEPDGWRRAAKIGPLFKNGSARSP